MTATTTVVGAVAKAAPHITTVALNPAGGTLPKHGRDTFSRPKPSGRDQMLLAKSLSYGGSQSRTKRSRQVDESSFFQPQVGRDETPGVLTLEASSPRTASVSVASRSLKAVAELFESASEVLWAAASWTVKEMLNGCAAYGMAMHGIPKILEEAETSDPTRSGPPALPKTHRDPPCR